LQVDTLALRHLLRKQFVTTTTQRPLLQMSTLEKMHLVFGLLGHCVQELPQKLSVQLVPQLRQETGVQSREA
jgi:hypothetical protein